MDRYDSLQLREVFHIEFLRWFGRIIKPDNYTVKGGVNLRLFFKSFRYSEDMDIDVSGVKVIQLKEAVMKILDNRAFMDTIKPFGIITISAPDMSKAKQTETTQRFKIHLLSSAGEDLFTKIEFSRRGFSGNAVIEPVNDAIMRAYKLAPLLVPHYDNASAVMQKIDALASRKSIQARDIFDLYVLSSQYTSGGKQIDGIAQGVFSKAYGHVFEVEFEQFRDTVVSYLSTEDQGMYNNPESWAEVCLKTANFIEEVRKTYA